MELWYFLLYNELRKQAASNPSTLLLALHFVYGFSVEKSSEIVFQIQQGQPVADLQAL